MSVEAITAVLHHSQATGRAKLVLIGIANHLGDHGAWPSIDTLAKYSNASTRSVKRDIRELIELGELLVESQAAPVGGQYRTNLYRILVQCPAECDGSFGHRLRGDRLGKNDVSGVTDGASGVTDWVSRGDTVGTQNNINQHINLNKRAKRIDEGWKPSDELVSWTQETAPQLAVDKEVERFVDYWLSASGANASKLDWNRTWKNWIRSAVDRRPELAKKVNNNRKRITNYAD